MTANRYQRTSPPPSAVATTATLALIAVLHVAWAHGSSLPFSDRANLFDAVLGGPTNQPSRTACYTVAAGLAAGATAVHRASSRRDQPTRLIAQGVALTLATRALIGFAGWTHRYMPGATSSRFQRLDQRVYSPLCATLAAGAAHAAWCSTVAPTDAG